MKGKVLVNLHFQKLVNFIVLLCLCHIPIMQDVLKHILDDKILLETSLSPGRSSLSIVTLTQNIKVTRDMWGLYFVSKY